MPQNNILFLSKTATFDCDEPTHQPLLNVYMHETTSIAPRPSPSFLLLAVEVWTTVGNANKMLGIFLWDMNKMVLHSSE